MLSHSENVLDEDQSELMQAVIEFDDIMVCQVMTARVDMEAIDIDDSFEEIMATVDASAFSRLPVYEDSIDHIIGVLSQNTLCRVLAKSETVEIRSLLKEPVFLYKTTKLPAAIAMLKEAGQRLGIVVDEYGGTEGIVSLEDIMEQLIGEIWDEKDPIEADEIVEYSDGVYECDGDMHIYEFADMMDWDADELDIESETVGGMTTELYGTFPSVDDVVTIKNVEIKVLEVDGMRVSRVLVTRLEDPEEEEDA